MAGNKSDYNVWVSSKDNNGARRVGAVSFHSGFRKDVITDIPIRAAIPTLAVSLRL
jgi:hypothetical protein